MVSVSGDMGEWLLWVFLVQGMSWGYSYWQELESWLPWSFPVFAGGLSFWLPQQSTQVASVLHLSLRQGLFTTWWLTSPRVSKEEVLVLFMTSSPKYAHHHFCFILFITSESLSLVYIQRRRIKPHPLKGGVFKHLWTYLNLP